MLVNIVDILDVSSHIYEILLERRKKKEKKTRNTHIHTQKQTNKQKNNTEWLQFLKLFFIFF